ncbi:UNVERIFIED_CONTAM: hypothetical protein K2H54_072593 [Gekko kuhli]
MALKGIQKSLRRRAYPERLEPPQSVAVCLSTGNLGQSTVYRSSFCFAWELLGTSVLSGGRDGPEAGFSRPVLPSSSCCFSGISSNGSQPFSSFSKFNGGFLSCW